MAVRAQNLKVLEPVVVAVAVDVMQGERDPEAPPFSQPTCLAATRLDPGIEQTSLEVITVAPRASNQELLEWNPRRPRGDQASLYGGVPGLLVEPEVGAAIVDAVAFLIEMTDGVPVVPSSTSIVDIVSESRCVVRDRGAGKAKGLGDLRPRGAPLE
jgi:hypothetical protein